MPTITAPSVTPTVVGWNTDANATTNDSSYSTSTGNITLTSSNTGKTWYAITKKNAVTLKATANTNGSGLSGSTTPTCTIAESYNGIAQASSCEVTMPTVTPHSNTPTFVGWNLSASGTTNDSNYNMTTNKLTLTNSNSGKNWYAITRKDAVTLTVKVDANSGTLSSTSDVGCTIAETYNAMGQATSCYAKMPTGTKTGYSHIGWNTDSTATTSDSNYGTSSGNLKITKDNTGTIWYAIYKAKSYKVTFNPNGGKVSPTYKLVTFDSNYGKDSTLPTPTRADSTDSASGKTISYAFEGWYTAANGGTKVTDETLVNTASNHSIYAHWISKPIITGGSADWFKGRVAIGISTIKDSVSDTSDVTYEYYISTSNESQIGGEWKNNGSANMISLTFSESGVRYIFFRAISSAGVYSDISNYQTLKIDADNPNLSVTGNPTSWVTTDIILKVSASDSTSGLKSVTANGKALSLNNGVTSYTVSANGTYTFVATDVAGNTTTQNVVVSKIDKVTPTAPVITGGSTTYSDTNDANGVKVYVKTAGTTGPSGVQKYEIEAHNFLTDVTPAFHKVISGFTISDKTYTTTNSDPYIRFDDFGPDGVYFNNVIIAFTQPTTKDISLRVYAWAKGSSPSAGQKISVTVPKGTNGWYYVPNFTAGTYDGLQFNFGGTAGDTYTINSFRYVNSTSSSKASDNYAYTESRRGQTGIYYRTVANNGLKSSWTTLDANSWSYISKVVVRGVNNKFKYTTVQKAVDLLKGQGGEYLALIKDTYEAVTIPSGTNYPIELSNHSIIGGITNNGTLSFGNGYINSYYSSGRSNVAIVNNGTLYINGNVTLYGGLKDTSGGTAIWSKGGTTNITGNNSIYGMTGSAIKVEGGTITVGTGTTVSSNVSNSVVANAGTFNLNGGTVNGPSGNAISSNTNGTINILSGTVNSTNNSGIYSAGTLNISGGKISTNKAGKNGVFIESGTAKITDGEIFNVVDDNNCSGALTLASTSTKGLTMTGGYIHGCVGINYQSGTTGLIDIQYNSNATNKTQIVGNHTGIKINTTSNATENILRIGYNSSDSIYPFVRTTTDGYFAVDLGSSTRKLNMYSGRLRSISTKNVFNGVASRTKSNGKTWTVASGGTYYDAWFK